VGRACHDALPQLISQETETFERDRYTMRSSEVWGSGRAHQLAGGG